MSICIKPIATAFVVLLSLSSCSTSTTLTAVSRDVDAATSAAVVTIPEAPAAPESPEPTAAPTSAPAQQPAPAPTSPPTAASAPPGVVTGVIDLPVRGVLDTELRRSAFLSPKMQERLDQLLRPDSLVEPRPEGATLISGLRKAQGDSFGDQPWILDSDVRFFTWAHEVHPTTSLEVITPSYLGFSETVNGVAVSVGPRGGGPNWIIEPVGQTPAERRQRRSLPHLVTIDTILRGGSSYNIERLLLTKFRFAHRSAVIGSTPLIADTMPEWVRAEAAILEPIIETTGMRITAWEAAVAPDWLSDLPAAAQGLSTVRITLGTSGNVVYGEPDAGVFPALKELGEQIGEQGDFAEITYSSETETSGSYTYKDGDRSLRYYHAAGPSLGESYITFSIDESNDFENG